MEGNIIFFVKNHKTNQKKLNKRKCKQQNVYRHKRHAIECNDQNKIQIKI